MEVRPSRSILSTPRPHQPLLFSNEASSLKAPHFPFPQNKLFHFPGGVLVCHTKRGTPFLLRATFDETSGQSSYLVKEKKNEEDDSVGFLKPYIEISQKFKVDDDDSSSGDGVLPRLKEFYFKLEFDVLYGGVAAVAFLAVWFVSAIIDAIDSVPVFPKLLKVVGLGYSIWFATRYLLFKKNREELGSKIEELKQEIFGSSNE